jgi:hypothetical protein
MCIAFLFLITDVIHCYDLWKHFFESSDRNKWNIYVHQKTNCSIGWFDQYKLPTTVPTKWGDYSLIRAQNLLLSHAMTDPQNSVMVMLSGTCAPIRNMEYIEKYLDPRYSYFHQRPIDDIQRYNRIKKFIKFKDFKKASQWCILNRKHIEILLNSDKYMYQTFKNVFCPDEHAYISTLIKQNKIDEIKDVMTTMVCWDHGTNKGYDQNIGDHPKYYFLMDINEYKKFRADKDILFIRKINKSCLLSRNMVRCADKIEYEHVFDRARINNSDHIAKAYDFCVTGQYNGFIHKDKKFLFTKDNKHTVGCQEEDDPETTIIFAKKLEHLIIEDLTADQLNRYHSDISLPTSC